MIWGEQVCDAGKEPIRRLALSARFSADTTTDIGSKATSDVKAISHKVDKESPPSTTASATASAGPPATTGIVSKPPTNKKEETGVPVSGAKAFMDNKVDNKVDKEIASKISEEKKDPEKVDPKSRDEIDSRITSVDWSL